MRLFIVILAAALCGLVASLDSSSKDTMYIDPLPVDVTTIKPNQKANSKDSEISGDDEGSGDVQADSSGSGSSGVVPTVRTVAATSKDKKDEDSLFKVVTVKKVASTKSTTESEPVTEAPKIITEKIKEIEATTVQVDTTKPTQDEDVMGGGIGLEEDGNVQARKQDKEGLRVLTKEVIAAVIVGGICAIILIAFLVYRLRKRDEGSYVLTDSAYKDTNKLRGDPGKEAFV